MFDFQPQSQSLPSCIGKNLEIPLYIYCFVDILFCERIQILIFCAVYYYVKYSGPLLCFDGVRDLYTFSPIHKFEKFYGFNYFKLIKTLTKDTSASPT